VTFTHYQEGGNSNISLPLWKGEGKEEEFVLLFYYFEEETVLTHPLH